MREIFIRVFDLIAGAPDESEVIVPDFEKVDGNIRAIHEANWELTQMLGREPSAREIYKWLEHGGSYIV